MKRINIFLVVLSLLFVTSLYAENNSIVEVAEKAGSFSTLTKALQEADLVKILDEEGPFTVFAPTDEAFAKLPEGALQNLLNDKEALKNVLLSHVVKGKVTAADVVKYEQAKTLSGDLLDIKTSDSYVKLNDAKVIKTDIKASNGIIHVIDRVILPK